MAGFESKVRAHKALNAQCTQGGNQARLGFKATFGQDPPPTASPFALSC